MPTGSIVIDLLMKTGAFVTDTDRAAKKVKSFEKSVTDTAKNIAGAFAGLQIGRAVFDSFNNFLKVADETQKSAQRLGLAGEALTELRFAAELSGVQADQLSDAIRQLNVNAASNSSAFKALGVDVRDATGKLKDSDVLITEIANKFQQFRDGTEKAALAARLFGESGVRLVPLLNAGADGLEAMRQEARDLGLVLDEDTRKATESVNDNFTRLNAITDGITAQIGAALVPTLKTLTDSLVKASLETGGFEEAASAAATGLRLLITAGEFVAAVFNSVGKGIGAVAAAITQVAQGNFSQAFDILNDNARDTIESNDKAWERIQKIWEDGASAVQKTAADTRPEAPNVKAFEEAQKAATKAAESAAKEAERAAKARASIIEGLIKERDTFGQTSAETKLYELALKGASDAELEFAASIQAEIDALAEKQKLIDRGRDLTTSLQTPNEQFQTGLEELNALIEANAITPDIAGRQYAALTTALDETLQAQADRIQQARDQLYSGLITEEELIQQSYERRMADILESQEITDAERTDLMLRNAKQRNDLLQELEEDRIGSLLNANEQFFGGLARLAKNNIGETSTAYKILFGVSKAFAIADATLHFTSALVKALDSGPFPANLAALANVAATGAALIGQISSVSFSGGRASGGSVDPRHSFLVGERGPEMFVPSTSGTIIPNHAFGSQEPPVVNVRNINAFDPGIIDDYLGSETGSRTILNVIQRNSTSVRQSLQQS